MLNFWKRSLSALLVFSMVFLLGAQVFAADSSDDTSGIADASAYYRKSEVGREGMAPLYPEDIEEGTYEIEVETSSSMFPVTHCDLIVADGKFQAKMTLGGKEIGRAHV